MRTKVIPAVALAVVAAGGGVAAVQALDGSASLAATKKTATTTSGLKKAKWGENVKVTYSSEGMRFRSDGIPNHERDTQYAVPSQMGVVPTSAAQGTAVADPTKAQSYDYTIPTKPKKAAKTTSAPLGVIGVMISGATLFNPYEGDGKTVATKSNFFVTASDGTKAYFLDSCSGHPTPTGGQYHYHALPKCVTKEVDETGGRSHLIGVAFDGFPIYGDRDIKGKKVKASKLDKCNGLTSATPEFPKGIYHYVLLDVKSSRSSIRCFRGEVDSSFTSMSNMPGMGGMGGGGMPPMGTTGGAR